MQDRINLVTKHVDFRQPARRQGSDVPGVMRRQMQPSRQCATRWSSKILYSDRVVDVLVVLQQLVVACTSVPPRTRSIERHAIIIKRRSTRSPSTSRLRGVGGCGSAKVMQRQVTTFWTVRKTFEALFTQHRGRVVHILAVIQRHVLGDSESNENRGGRTGPAQ